MVAGIWLAVDQPQHGFPVVAGLGQGLLDRRQLDGRPDVDAHVARPLPER